jgi:Tfp pilus assembly protein PilZ
MPLNIVLGFDFPDISRWEHTVVQSYSNLGPQNQTGTLLLVQTFQKYTLDSHLSLVIQIYPRVPAVPMEVEVAWINIIKRRT